jgi:Ca2+-binding RTX toxin-like protein
MRLLENIASNLRNTDSDNLNYANIANDVATWLSSLYSGTNQDQANAGLGLANDLFGLLAQSQYNNPLLSVLSVESSYYLFQENAQKWVNDTSSVPAFADTVASLGNLVSAIGLTVDLPNVTLAGNILNSYGILLHKAADLGSTINIDGWLESITQEAARTESLAYVKYLAQRIDPVISVDTFLSHIDSSANDASGLVEANAFLSGLKNTLGLDDTTSPNTPDEVFADVISALQSVNSLYGENAFRFSTPPASASEARTNFGALLSLVHLTPFVLKPTSIEANVNLYTGTLKNIEIALKWEQDKVLTPDQIANGEQNFSDKWLADRIDMLAWKNNINIEDINTSPDNPASSPRPIGRNFFDLATSSAIFTGNQNENTQQIIFGNKTANGAIQGLAGDDHLYGGAGNDTLTGNNGNDYLEGNEDSDTLDGGAGNDILLGGTGDDTLKGGKDSDQLFGGQGNDTYIYNSGDGFDAIVDSDGLGQIKIGATVLSLNGGKKLGDNLYQSADGKFYFIFNPKPGTATGDLYISAAKESGLAVKLLVKDFTDGNLGLSLQGTTPAAPEATLVGDFKKKIDDHGTQGTTDDTYVLTNGNYTPDETAPAGEPGALDLITGTDGNDVIDGKGGSDALSGKAGDDYIEGGTEGDFIQGGLGKDTLNGGAGDDAIYGSSDQDLNLPTDVNFTKPVNDFANPWGTGFNWVSGNDTVFENGVPAGYSDAPRNRLADDQGNLIDAGAGNDFIAGGTGADVVHGGADKDKIWGMDEWHLLKAILFYKISQSH